MRLMGLSSITTVKDTGRGLLGYVLIQGGSVMRTENRVVLASPELRMAPLGSDNFDPNADLRTRQYTLNQEKSGLDFEVHYRTRLC